MHGPFVGENLDDIRRLSRLYTEGKMPRISELAGSGEHPAGSGTHAVFDHAQNETAEATSGDRN
jgi:hypothetical protein